MQAKSREALENRKEITLKGHKNGMAVLFFVAVLYVFSILLVIFGASEQDYILLIPGVVILCIGWFPLLGLRVLKPEEALVLTLFGRYYGTIRGDGFFWVNPFCSSINPAAKTQLNQSGDVKTVNPITVSSAAGLVNNKLSLKVMTLNNNRQKINDRLGTPVEIGIAVTWSIADTAKAVFNVENFKEYLSLQCDTSLRNIVRIYPYDVAQGVDTT
ncbi:MAG: SPFH domain-containing protein, partial [Lachnospiraceae bacterium]|nr:SPFH domain-containing protein [Lachnospiraceae bacterium]